MNSVVIAEFFNTICDGIFKHVFRSGQATVGLLGKVKTHYAVVEANGRGMLHMHGFVWLLGNIDFKDLRQKITEDVSFKSRMIEYLQSLLRHSIPEHIKEDESARSNYPRGNINVDDILSDAEYVQEVVEHGDRVAFVKNMHRHNKSCHKYQKEKDGPCRYRYPRKLVPETCVSEHGVIELRRNHPMLNPYNPVLEALVAANTDMSFLPTTVKMLALLFYMTNYATKDDLAPEQILARCALLKANAEKQHAMSYGRTQALPDAGGNFVLRCANALARDTEVSSVQMVHNLLGYEDCFQANNMYRRINLYWVRKAVQSLIKGDGDLSAAMADQPCGVSAENHRAFTIFDDYTYRGSMLEKYCFFEYLMLTSCRKKNSRTKASVKFAAQHPRSETHVQILATTPSQIYTVIFSGSLSTQQQHEDAIKAGHPTTPAIKNDIAEILLGFFVPWQRLVSLKSRFFPLGNFNVSQDCSHLWEIIKGDLKPYLQDFAANLQNLRKSKDEARIDQILQQNLTEEKFTDDNEVDVVDFEDEEPSFTELSDPNIHIGHISESHKKHLKNLSTEAMKRLGRGHRSKRKMPPVLVKYWEQHPSSDSVFTNFISKDIWTNRIGLSMIDEATLKSWKSTSQFNPDITQNQSGEDLDGIANADAAETADEPHAGQMEAGLEYQDTEITLERAQTIIENMEHISADLIIDMMKKKLPLNKKQHLMIHRVLNHFLQISNPLFTNQSPSQFLLYVGGEGGVKKSRIIQALKRATQILQFEDRCKLMIFTGAAAVNILKSTIHSALELTISEKKKGSC